MCAKKIGMDPVAFRLQERGQGRHADDATVPRLGMALYRDAGSICKNHARPRGRNKGPTRAAASPRAIGSTRRCERSSATIQLNADGTSASSPPAASMSAARGASMALMAAETFGVDYSQVRAIVADTASVGYTHVTAAARVNLRHRHQRSSTRRRRRSTNCLGHHAPR